MAGHFEKREPPVVALVGDIDLDNVRGLQEMLESVARDHGHVVADLSLTTFMDSSALAALLLTDRHGYRVVVRAAHGEPLRALDACGATDLLEFED